MMNIILNGKNEPVSDGTTVANLLSGRNLNNNLVVVEINERIVPRENFMAYRLSNGDVVEILRFVGGG